MGSDIVKEKHTGLKVKKQAQPDTIPRWILVNHSLWDLVGSSLP